MKKYILQLITKIAIAYTKHIKGNARTSILVDSKDKMFEIDIYKVDDEITVTTVT